MEKLFLGKDAYLEISELSTHVFICGVTGSGKTVMGKILVEESLKKQIPVIVFDMKGDLFSLAIPYEFYNEKMFKKLKLGSYKDYLKKLEEWGFKEEDVKEFKKNVNVLLFSPTGVNGIPLGYSPIPKKPDDKEMYHEMLSFASSNIVSLLDSGKDLSIEEALIQSIIDHFWKNGEEMYGVSGLMKLISAVVNPPIKKVGIMKLEEFIPKKKRLQLANMLNAKLVSFKKFFHGVDASDTESLICEGSSLTIIDLSSVHDFETLSQIVATVLLGIYNWMKRKGESEIPRLIVFIDEIGGGGGKTSLLPSDPYKTPSKVPLRLLIKQGRAFGVGMILATQNPADVDYRSLSNCLTWFVGKLNRKTDRKKVLEGIVSSFERDFTSFETDINSLTPGKLILVKRTGEYTVFNQRWLLTPHKTLSKTEKEIVYKHYEPFFKKILQNEKFLDDDFPSARVENDYKIEKDIKTEIIATPEKVLMVMKEITDRLLKITENKINKVESKYKELLGKYEELRNNLTELVRINIKERLMYLDELSKDEIKAVFDGFYVKKGFFSKKEFRAKTISEALDLVVEIFQKTVDLFINEFSPYGVVEKDIRLKENLVQMLNGLKESVFKLRKKKEMKELIYEKVGVFFNGVLERLESWLKNFREKVESSYENKISILNTLKTRVENTYRSIKYAVDELYEVEKILGDVDVEF